jgi:predicted short-subunit dehydrogenase-like oxidoreductase (DUF2520 family)
MRVGIIGPGRLGRTLALLLADRGWTVDLRGGRVDVPLGEVVLLTVPDAAIAEVAARVPPGPIVLHCSGAAGIDVLRPHRPAGSLHPLMTFPGPEIAVPDLRGVAAAVAGDEEAQQAARAIAGSLGLVPIEVPGDRRLYHAAAVMAGNFATVLLADAASVLASAGVAPEIAASMLGPLAVASLRNALPDPARALTGPAARGDEATIAAHREALAREGLAGPLAVYDTMTSRARVLRPSVGDPVKRG